jgi:glyoxylase-like metal-dependent hydrolase (beta-lactamase superfamily II)
MSSQTALVESFFDPATFTVTHLLADPATGRAAIVDPVLDYDPKSGRTSTGSAEAVLARVRERGLQVEWLLETHAHADHLSAAPWLKAQLGGGRIAIGAGIGEVQQRFADILHAEDLSGDGREFDTLFRDGDRFRIGALEVEVLHTPGHTPACISYHLPGARIAFVGDTLFMPDYGTARADFPGGDARQLYRSIQRLLALPPETELYLCHDYPPAHRGPQWRSSVAEQRKFNLHCHEGVDEEAYVALRTARDKTLSAPVLIWPSLQVNLRAGHLPPPESNGRVYLKTPLNVL